MIELAPGDPRARVVSVPDTKYPPLYLRVGPDGSVHFAYTYPGPLWHDLAEHVANDNESIATDADAIKRALAAVSPLPQKEERE